MGSTIIPSSKYPTPYPGQSSGVGTFFPSGTIAPSSTLLNDLVSYWPLNEESGVRADVVGDNDLTDNNTVGYDVGVNGAAASFVVANAEKLTNASAVQGGGDSSFTWSGWVKYVDDNYLAIASEWDDAKQSWLVYKGAGFLWISAKQAADNTQKDAQIAAATGAWHFVIAGYNADTDTIFISVDNSALTETACAGLKSLGSGFGIGGVSTAASPLLYEGQIDEVAIWSRVLTADERTELYNAGAGKFYPFPL